jgi:hypothetical protein
MEDAIIVGERIGALGVSRQYLTKQPSFPIGMGVHLLRSVNNCRLTPIMLYSAFEAKDQSKMDKTQQ